MKTILWDTNFNNKLGCNSFAHIDLAPIKPPTREAMDQTVFTIRVADGSHQPVKAKVESIITFRLTELSNIHTWPSHGMNTADFINWQYLKNNIRRDTMLAVYYYKKVEDN